MLEPHPGRDFLPENQQYVVPEIFVNKVDDEYVVTNNNDQVPHLRISNAYKDIMSQAESSAEVREWIREKIRAGKFLIKSLHQRQETILNIAREIVNRQREFMEEVHVSTVQLLLVDRLSRGRCAHFRRAIRREVVSNEGIVDLPAGTDS